MKKIVLSAIILLNSVFAFADIPFNDLVGSYKVTVPKAIADLGNDIFIEYDINLKADETITLTEKIVQKLAGEEKLLNKLECSGAVTQSENLLISSVTCTVGSAFVQTVDLSNVKDFKKPFSADVTSSLYGMTVNMTFTPTSSN